MINKELFRWFCNELKDGQWNLESSKFIRTVEGRCCPLLHVFCKHEPQQTEINNGHYVLMGIALGFTPDEAMEIAHASDAYLDTDYNEELRRDMLIATGMSLD